MQLQNVTNQFKLFGKAAISAIREVVGGYELTSNNRWASAMFTSSGSVVVCIRSADKHSTLVFENAQELKKAIRTKHLSISKWVVSVPDKLCITKSLTLPASDAAQAHKMLEFELLSHIPLPIEEIIYGTIPQEHDGGMLDVSVHIIKKNRLKNILGPYKEIGIKPARVLVDSVAIDGWFKRNGRCDGTVINLLFTDDKCIAVGASEGECRLYNQLQIPEDKGIESIAEDIQSMVEGITADSREKLIFNIAAKSQIAAAVKQSVEERFAQAQFYDVPVPTLLRNDSELDDDQFVFESVAANGLLYAAEDKKFDVFNLLPRELLKKSQKKQLQKNWLTAVGLSIGLVICVWLNFALVNWRIQRGCDKIENQITPIRKLSTTIENKRQQVKAIQKQLYNRDQISRIFSQLYQYSPQDICISQMNFDSKADSVKFNIKGQAKTLSNAFGYSDAMKDAKLLQGIQIVNAQQIPRPGGSVIEFAAECLIKAE